MITKVIGHWPQALIPVKGAVALGKKIVKSLDDGKVLENVWKIVGCFGCFGCFGYFGRFGRFGRFNRFGRFGRFGRFSRFGRFGRFGCFGGFRLFSVVSVVSVILVVSVNEDNLGNGKLYNFFSFLPKLLMFIINLPLMNQF